MTLRNRPRPAWILSALVLLLAGGCAGGPSPLSSLTTGTLLGGKPPEPAPLVAPANTPINRAFQVGSVSARAVKCGFNFDADRLKASYLASEAQNGGPVEDIAKAEKVYQVAFNGVMKAANGKDGYCAEVRTKQIKQDLALLLGGDYSPQAPRPKIDEENTDLLQFGSITANNPLH